MILRVEKTCHANSSLLIMCDECNKHDEAYENLFVI